MRWARPVPDKLGPAGGLLVGLGLSLVSDTSDRPGQQEVMLFRTISQLSAHFPKMDPWSWTPTNPENFKARRTGLLFSLLKNPPAHSCLPKSVGRESPRHRLSSGGAEPRQMRGCWKLGCARFSSWVSGSKKQARNTLTN